MRARLIYLVVTLASLAAWLGGFSRDSWPDGYF